MKRKKQKWSLINLPLIAILIFSVVMGGVVDAKAAEKTEGRFITIGGKTITETMKIEDVLALFGEPKLVTSSYWGGSAYTFYGTDYSDYLYLETYSDGSIASYGSVSEGFETNFLGFGDMKNANANAGQEASDYDGKVYGVIYYTDVHSDAYEIFQKNIVENNRSICKHATLMWNAISYLYGYHTPTVYNEQLYNINLQLAENGSDWYEYCNNTNRESYFQLCGWSSGSGSSLYQYPNPLYFAKDALHYSCNEGYASAFIYIPKEKTTDMARTTGFINPDIVEEWNKVPYTQEEQALLQEVRKTYMDSIETFNAQTSYYDVEPQFEMLPLTGGKLNENAAKGAVGYLNCIRVGAGLNPLEYSEELSLAAQCKSAYVVYLSQNDIALSDPHNPPQIEGVDDEFYAKCQAGEGENLFACGILSTNVIGSITNALDDTAGVGQHYSRGHRYNLLDPNWKSIGVGNTMQQGCHKMSGYEKSSVEAVAWPSKGIMPVESGFSADTMMTCKFYNGYRVTDNTTVRIHCLNNDLTWEINPDNLLEGQDMKNLGNMIAYKDNSISFASGGVYEITFDHMKNEQDEDVSYSYRSVVESAYLDALGEDAARELTLDKTSLKMNPQTVKKIKTTIAPFTAKNKRIYWQSEDPDIVTVNECGEVTAHSLGETDIRAMTEEGNLTATCHITVTSEAINDIEDGNVTHAPQTPSPEPSPGMPGTETKEPDTSQTPSSDSPIVKKGDANQDGKVDLEDARVTLMAALAIQPLSGAEFAAADVDDSGKVDLSDANKILRASLEIEPLSLSR